MRCFYLNVNEFEEENFSFPSLGTPQVLPDFEVSGLIAELSPRYRELGRKFRRERMRKITRDILFRSS